MRVTGEGLFAADTGEVLTPALFEARVARGEAFRVKADYRRLPPPVEELDLVHLMPAGLRVHTASLVLRALRDGGYDLTWTPPGPIEAPAAIVTAVERPAMHVRLDRWTWRVVGSILARRPVLTPAFTTVRDLALRLWRPVPPAEVPLVLPDVDTLIAGVRAKWSAPGEVRRLVVQAAGRLEAWEKDIVDRVLPPGGRVLVVGCGAGREALALARHGFRVTAIDFAATLVDEARRLAAACGVDVTFETTTAEALAARTPGAFDAAFCTPAVYEQIPGRARRVRFLEALARLGGPAPVIVLCVGWHDDRGPRRLLIDALRRLLRALGVRRVAEPGDRLTYHLSVWSDHRTACFIHAFQRPDEIDREIRAAGLVADRHSEGPWLLRRSR